MDSYQTCAEKEKSTHANTIWNQLLQLPKGKEKEKGKGKGRGANSLHQLMYQKPSKLTSSPNKRRESLSSAKWMLTLQ